MYTPILTHQLTSSLLVYPLITNLRMGRTHTQPRDCSVMGTVGIYKHNNKLYTNALACRLSDGEVKFIPGFEP